MAHDGIQSLTQSRSGPSRAFWRSVLCVLLLATLAPACLAAGSEDVTPYPPQTVGQSIGVNHHVTGKPLSDDAFDAMVRTGVSYIRVGYMWHQIEKERGQYDWEASDRLDAMVRTRDLHPIYVLCYGNGIYNDGDDATMNSESERQGFAAFAAAYVKRYDRPGVLWEIWNEQNGFKFWKATNRDVGPHEQAKENATNYVALLQAAVPGMRQQSPNAVVISGGVINPGWDVTKTWLDQAMSLGMLDLVDGVGVHFYNRNHNHEPDTYVLDHAEGVRELIRNHGVDPATMPILHTEWGPSIEKHILTGTHEERLMMQANLIIRMQLLTQLAGVPLNVTYQWNEHGNGSYQVYDPASPRPALTALNMFAQELGPYRLQRRIPVGNPDVFVLAFEHDGQTKLAVWSAGEDQEVAIPVRTSADELTTVQMLGEAGTVAVDHGRIRLRATASPQYIALPNTTAE